MRLSAEILPVVCVNTLATVMLNVVKWAPNCFVIKDIKIVIVLEVVNKLGHDVVFTVCKRAVRPVLAIMAIMWIMCAELSFLFVRPVQLLNLVV